MWKGIQLKFKPETNHRSLYLKGTDFPAATEQNSFMKELSLKAT